MSIRSRFPQGTPWGQTYVGTQQSAWHLGNAGCPPWALSHGGTIVVPAGPSWWSAVLAPGKAHCGQTKIVRLTLLMSPLSLWSKGWFSLTLEYWELPSDVYLRSTEVELPASPCWWCHPSVISIFLMSPAKNKYFPMYMYVYMCVYKYAHKYRLCLFSMKCIIEILYI